VQAVTARAHGNLIVDLGAGPGTYLMSVLDHLPQAQGLAFDVSKPALKRAARLSPRLGAVLADTWREIPLRDGAADCVLNVFAPRNGPEMHRVLHEEGTLIVVTPAPDHLIEPREELGLLNVDESKPDRLAATLSQFTLLDHEALTWQMELSAAEATLIVHMGPNAFHGPASLTKPMTVTASVSVTTWKGRSLPTPAAQHDADR
jgi:23S rRNA (guanine745-N1)-methyltransferase